MVLLMVRELFEFCFSIGFDHYVGSILDPTVGMPIGTLSVL